MEHLLDPIAPLRADVEVEGADTALILTGELDLLSRRAFREKFSSIASTSTGRVILDLSELQFMDIAGLRALEEAQGMVGDRLIVRCPSPAVRRVLELTGGEHRLAIQMTPSKLGYVRSLWRAFEHGGARAMAELVPDDVQWSPWPAGGRTLSGTDELKDYWRDGPSTPMRVIAFDQVGSDVVIHLSRFPPGSSPIELWSVYHFEGDRLVQAVTFTDQSRALAFAG